MRFYKSLINAGNIQLKPENHKALIDSLYDDINKAEEDIEILENKYKGQHNLYTVDIPDNDGSNYLGYTERVGEEKAGKIGSYLESIGFERTSSSIPTFEKDGEKAVINPRAQGQDIYAELSDTFGSDKEASRILNEAGFVGIEYPAEMQSGGRKDEAKNYVIFNEKDMKIVDHKRFLKTSDGTVYGWTQGGKIYLTKKGLNPNTPLHEYTHLFDMKMMQDNPELWNRGKELMKECPVWKEVMDDKNYSDIKDDDDKVASEVHSRLAGRNGSKLFTRMAEDARKGGFEESIRKFSVIAALKSWLKEAYRWIASKNPFRKEDWTEKDLNRMTLDDWNAMPLAELARKGKTQNETERIVSEAEKNGTYMKAPNGKPTKLNEKQWAQVRTKNFKDWFGDWEEDTENASKVVDENGEPMVVYHGTVLEEMYFKDGLPYTKSIDKFYSFNNGKGFFTSDYNAALKFARGNKSKVYSCFLNIANPKGFDAKGLPFDDFNIDGKKYSTDEAVYESRKDNSTDGTIIFNVSDEKYGEVNNPIDEYIPNSAIQIKSAINSNGDFSGTNDDIRYQFADNKSDFESMQKRAVEEKGTVMPGLKTAEVKVIDVPKHDFTGDKPIAQAKEWAKDNLVGDHTMDNGDVYNISNGAIGKYLSESATGETKSDNLGVHLAVLKKLPEVINASIDAEIHPDYNKVNGVRSAGNGVNRNDLIVHRMYGAVNIDGTTYRVKTTMHEYSPDSGKSNSPHSYEVTKIELLEKQTAPGAQEAHFEIKTDYLGTANLLKGVEKSYDKGKKLLDESEDLTNEGDNEEQKTWIDANDVAKPIIEYAKKDVEVYHNYIRANSRIETLANYYGTTIKDGLLERSRKKKAMRNYLYSLIPDMKSGLEKQNAEKMERYGITDKRTC